MVHYGAGRLSLKGSCSITVAEVSGAGESMERWSHTATPHPPPPKSLLDHTLRCSIIQLVLAPRNLVAQ